MKVCVDGKRQELSYIVNGVDNSEVFVNEYGSGIVFNEEMEMYMMSQETFDWWTNMFDMMQQVDELEEELSPEMKETYHTEVSGVDLEATVSQQLEWLKTHICLQ